MMRKLFVTVIVLLVFATLSMAQETPSTPLTVTELQWKALYLQEHIKALQADFQATQETLKQVQAELKARQPAPPPVPKEEAKPEGKNTKAK